VKIINPFGQQYPRSLNSVNFLFNIVFIYIPARIQSLKHSAPKGDKKRKKQVTIEAAQLQAELDRRHEQELDNVRETICYSFSRFLYFLLSNIVTARSLVLIHT